MRIFLVAEFSHGALGASYSSVFQKLRNNVIEFDITSRMKFPFSLFQVFDLNKAFIKQALNEKPDLIFIIKGAFILPETLNYIKNKINTKLYCFNPDNPFNLNKGASNENIRKSIPFYDCYFIWGKFLIPELLKAGAKKVEYLPFAYDPELHYPVTVTEEEKKIYGSDIAFIGSYDKEREEFLLNLIDYNLAIWGSGWNKLPFFSPLRKKWKGRNAIGEDFSKVCNASKIILNHIRVQNGNAHNMRTFEIPACGGFMLTEYTEEQCEFFEEDKEVVYFSDIEELKEKVNYYLTNNELRKQIFQAGHNKVMKYSYMERAKTIIDILKKSQVIINKDY